MYNIVLTGGFDMEGCNVSDSINQGVNGDKQMPGVLFVPSRSAANIDSSQTVRYFCRNCQLLSMCVETVVSMILMDSYAI